MQIFENEKEHNTYRGEISNNNISGVLLNNNSVKAPIQLSTTQKKAFEVIISTLDSKNGEITLETSFSESGVDSITFIKVVVALEGRFDFVFDDEMLLITAFPTIKSMIEYVETKTKLKDHCDNG